MKSENSSNKRLNKIQSEVSSHYLIKKNGEIINWFLIYILLGMQANLVGKILNL